MRIIFAGTPEFAVPALQRLCDGDHQVVAVYTQPDRPAGRGQQLQMSPVKQLAVQQNIPVFQPDNLKSADQQAALKDLAPDLMVVAAYGLLLPQAVLDIPRIGCLNIHASLLPRWRGASPIQQAILHGDEQSGVTLMKMALQLDAGDMIAKTAINISSRWSAGDLHDHLSTLGAELLADNLDVIEERWSNAEPQDETLVTYAAKLEKKQAEIDWNKSAIQLDREVRAYNPWPVSFSASNGATVRIWKAKPLLEAPIGLPGLVMKHSKSGVDVCCGEGVLRITELQFSGKRRCSAAEALNGRDLAGQQLGSTSIG